MQTPTIRLLADVPAEKEPQAKRSLQQSEPYRKLALERLSKGWRTRPNDLENQPIQLALIGVPAPDHHDMTDRDTASGVEFAELWNPVRQDFPLPADQQSDGAKDSHRMWRAPSMNRARKKTGR